MRLPRRRSPNPSVFLGRRRGGILCRPGLPVKVRLGAVIRLGLPDDVSIQPVHQLVLRGRRSPRRGGGVPRIFPLPRRPVRKSDGGRWSRRLCLVCPVRPGRQSSRGTGSRVSLPVWSHGEREGVPSGRCQAPSRCHVRWGDSDGGDSGEWLLLRLHQAHCRRVRRLPSVRR